MSSSNNLYKKAENYVRNIFDEYPNENLVYHDLEHTETVVKRAQEIAAHYQLTETDMLTVFIAAWFHDTGHLFTDINKHEEKSVELMREFMKMEHADESLIENVEKCILVTKMPHEPESLLQEILCDADTYHLGTKDFKKSNKKIKKELKLRNYETLVADWLKNTIDLMETHHFFTSYCKTLLNERKLKNTNWVRKKYLKKSASNTNAKLFDKDEDSTDKKNSKKSSLITRGIQTMLRLASQNHLELSNMADGKANILISVNSIIISVILSVLLRKLETEQHLTIPTIIFLLFSVSTIVIAILATRPKISEGRFTRNDVLNKQINLLFFGNYHKTTLQEYQWAMGIMMQSKDYLYGSLIQDIHQLGVVLGRKYRLIRIAYNVFMIGIIVSVVAFGIATILHTPEQTTIITNPSTSPL